MTKNLTAFALFCLLWSVPFYAVLQWASLTQDGRLIQVGSACILYAIGFAVAGTYWGSRDSRREARFALPVRYGVVSVLASMCVGGVWLAGWQRSDRITPYVYAALAALAMGIGYLLSWNRIKDMSKAELFK